MFRHSWVIILAVYGVSFALPAYAESIGLGAFLAALYYLPIAVLGCILGRSPLSFASVCLSWLANPVLWVGLMLLAKERWQGAARAGLVAALLASTPLLTQDYLHGLRIGYFAWLASMILLIAMSLAGWMILPERVSVQPHRDTVGEFVGRPEPRFSFPWLARLRASRKRPCSGCLERGTGRVPRRRRSPTGGGAAAGLGAVGDPDVRGPVLDELARLHGPQHLVRRPAPGEDGAAAEQHPGGPAGHLLPGHLLAGQPGHGLGRRPRPAHPAARAGGRALEPGDRRQRAVPQLRATGAGPQPPGDRRGDLRRHRADDPAGPVPPAAAGPGPVGILPGHADRQRPGAGPGRVRRHPLGLAVGVLHRGGAGTDRGPGRPGPARAGPRLQRRGRCRAAAGPRAGRRDAGPTTST